MSSWEAIDDLGCEQVDFKTMSWRYVQTPDDIDIRDIKRVDKNNWMITDDQGQWKSVDEDYPDSSETFELYYESYLKQQLHSIWRPM